jgi:hypothetical protein
MQPIYAGIKLNEFKVNQNLQNLQFMQLQGGRHAPQLAALLRLTRWVKGFGPAPPVLQDSFCLGATFDFLHAANTAARAIS